jgi:hypothetical protein
MVAQRNMAKTSSKPESFGKQLLLELANLHDAGADWFWKRWPFMKESPSTLYSLRNELRRIWKNETSMAERSEILNLWANYQHRGLLNLGYRQWNVSLRPPAILPDSSNLRGFLAFAVLIYLPLLAVCGNPDCPVRYFVARRRDQRYCGGECTEYAQRQYALKYWNEEGKHRRTEKSQREKKAKGK